MNILLRTNLLFLKSGMSKDNLNTLHDLFQNIEKVSSLIINMQYLTHFFSEQGPILILGARFAEQFPINLQILLGVVVHTSCALAYTQTSI